MTVTRGQHLIGKVLGSCVLEGLLGYGGSSAVFLAQEYNPERKVAVKVFLPKGDMDAQMQKDFYRRFLREAEAASKLDHSNILPIYSYGEQDGLPYIVMPYMPGGTLAEYLTKRGGPLSLPEAQWYLEQIAAALDYAHEHGCVHCDVKPANILLDSQGYVMLSDFGIARLMRTEEATAREAQRPRTKTPELVMGTPDYISPEQALGHEVDGRTDIYSLGITLFYMLTLQLPFRADTSIALALLHVHEVPPQLSLIRPDVTPELDQVLHQALAKSPDDRFQTASAFSRVFAQEVAARPKKSSRPAQNESAAVETSPVRGGLPTGGRTKRRARASSKRRLLVMLVACLVLLGGGGGTFLLYSQHIIGGVLPHQKATVNPASIDQFTNADDWPVSSTFFFVNRPLSYHIINKLANEGTLAPYYGHQYSDFHLSVTTDEISSSSQGTDYYGIIFRVSPDQSHYYFFGISTAQSGRYAFFRYDNAWSLISNGPAPELQTGKGVKNTISIDAHANSFVVQLNGHTLAQPLADTTPGAMPLTSGLVGLYVENQGTEVAFSQFHIASL